MIYQDTRFRVQLRVCYAVASWLSPLCNRMAKAQFKVCGEQVYAMFREHCLRNRASGRPRSALAEYEFAASLPDEYFCMENRVREL